MVIILMIQLPVCFLERFFFFGDGMRKRSLVTCFNLVVFLSPWILECAWCNNGETSQCHDNVINHSNGIKKRQNIVIYMYAKIISFT